MSGNQCKGVASWSQHEAYFTPEKCYGEKPTGPGVKFKHLRKVTYSPTLAREGIKSGEVRGDRLDGLTSLGNNNVTAELSAELSVGTYDDFIEALLCGTWTADVVHVGIERRSFYMWEKFRDIKKFRETTGMELNSLSLSVGVNGKVGMTWGMTGADLSYPEIDFPDAVWGQATTTEAADTFSGEIKVKGTKVATITSIELSAENGIEPLHVLFNRVAERSSINPFALNGNMSAYFDDDTLLQMFIGAERFEIEFTINMDGGAYTFRMPNCIFTEGNTETGAGNIPINFSFIADHDETSPIYITRKGSGEPVIEVQPEDVTVAAGTPATFTVKAKYVTSYQWEKQTKGAGDWAEVAGATKDTFTIPSPAAGDSTDKYRCVLKNSNATPEATLTSAEATLTIS